MAKSDVIKIEIKPNSSKGRSLLSDVIEQLDSLTAFLKSLVNDETLLEVKSISKNSPLCAELVVLKRTVVPVKPKLGEMRPKPRVKYGLYKTTSNRVVKTFDALNSDKKLPAFVDAYVLVQAKEFVDGLVKTDSTAIVSVGDRRYEIDEDLKKQIDARLGGSRIAYASFTGALDRLNAHGTVWTFTIFPPIGPSRILCKFNKDQIESVKVLVKEIVTVTGRAVYDNKSPWPLHIRVDSVTRKEPAPEGLWEKLPTMFREQWDSASDEEKESLDEGALGA